MLNEYVLTAITNILEEIFEAPEKDFLIWTHKHTKLFDGFNFAYECDTLPINPKLCLEDAEFVLDTISEFFILQPWPVDSETLNKLQHKVELYGWNFKPHE